MRSTSMFATLFLFFINGLYAQTDINAAFKVNGADRDYIVHLPTHYTKETKYPLVLIFHGGGGNYKGMQKYFGMDEIADREGFITVYPNGINKQWNDGREFKQSISANDDVLFTQQLLDTLNKNYAVDPARIFATGISNGGFFSIFLSYKLSDRFLAVAPVSATIPQKIYADFHPSTPISVLLINGTKDPLVPYNGGEVGNKLIGARGQCMSTDETIERYISTDKITANVIEEKLPDVKNDGCNEIKYTYAGGEKNTLVLLIKIINGGHAVPGRPQYLPKFIIGKVCEDFDANEMIWQFFKERKPR